jgi:hypothetical protein
MVAPEIKAKMARQVKLVPLALTENPEIKDHVDRPDHQDQLEKLAVKEPQAMLVKSSKESPARQAPQVPKENQARKALQEKVAKPEKMVRQVNKDLQANLDHQAVLAKLALQADLEMQASQVPQAAANTVHQLVWLQVIKRIFNQFDKRTSSPISKQFFLHQATFDIETFFSCFQFAFFLFECISGHQFCQKMKTR